MNPFILLLASPDATLARAGGKGANLSKLARAGFAVPPGFIVTTDAYREFVRANALQPRILGLARGIAPQELETLERTSAQIRMLFANGTLPAAVAADIVAAYRGLWPDGRAAGPAAVAVRSSATAEDLPGNAFAGQQDTYLNLIDQASVVDAVIKCWGSLWTARALAYRERNHIAPNDIALAVVVQQMVPSEVSGVLFTANPVTGRRDETVIDASFGLGEAVVSGQVTPDRYIVDSRQGRIVECVLGGKEVAIVSRASGGTETLAADNSGRQALPDALILELAQTGGRVAEHFGAPQDIEWATVDGRPYLLQARPITSLYPLPEPNGGTGDQRIYINFNAIQGFTDPLTPLGIDAIRLVFGGVPAWLNLNSSIRQLLPEAGGRLFMDMTDVFRDPRLRQAGFAFLAQTDPATRRILVRLIQEGRLAPRRTLTGRRMVSLVSTLLPILRRVLSALMAPEQVRPNVVAAADRFIENTQARARAATQLDKRLEAMTSDLSRAESISLQIMPSALPAFLAIPLLDRWLVDWLGAKPGAALELTRGLSDNATTAMDLNLWTAAEAVRADPAAAQQMQALAPETLSDAYRRGELQATTQRVLDEFLREYGMRASAELDIGRPRWRDDPAAILQTLRGYLQLEDPRLAPDAVFRRNKERAERLAVDSIARVRRTRWGWLRARLIGGALRRMRALAGLREVPLFYMIKALDIYRTVLLDSGRELAAQGELENNEDIFFVPLDTLKRFAANRGEPGAAPDLRAISATNRTQYDRERARRQMPRVLLSTGEAYYDSAGDLPAGGEDLAGDAVSPGIAEGRARVVLDPRNAHLEPGEILVCPSTDPGWTPLFLTAAGLVMEIGGMITHGSVVAREYGLPAVVGVHAATTRIKTGQRIRVDGNQGRVTVVE